jgi:integrase
MKQQYGLVKRPWGVYYLKNKTTGAQTTLKTSDKAEAQRLLIAHNDAENQSVLNLQLARVYLNGSDPKLSSRTWQEVMENIASLKTGPTKVRWERAINDKHFDCIRNLRVAETRAEHFYKALEDRTVSTNVYLRRIHNHALGMEWLLKSVIPRVQWPKPVYKAKRAITADEHAKIINAEMAAAERNRGSRNSDQPHYEERRDFYELLWQTGASQSDAANLTAEDVDWNQRTICYNRQKLKTRANVKPAIIRFGDALGDILRRRPSTGPLFPYLRTVRANDRATEFGQRCERLGIVGVSLHSYRYSWAERALKCGYPERFAQQALGHNSKAMHYAYTKRAEFTLPSREEWEKQWKKNEQVMQPVTVVPVNFQGGNEISTHAETLPAVPAAG